MYSTDKIYSDTDLAAIESLPPTAPHRNVDLEIVNADQEGECHPTPPLVIFIDKYT
jgi:hypothetical protein